MNPIALSKLSYGLYVVSSKIGPKFNGQIVNAVFQVTSEPPTIAVSINKKNLTHQYISETKAFAVSILSIETPLQFIGRFGFKSGRELDKFQDIKYIIGSTGTPIVMENILAYIEAEVIGSLDVNTHTIFIGKVIGAEVINNQEPLTYAYYHEIKHGRTPKTAPTFNEISVQVHQEVEKMERYECTVCGYIYDPEQGDPDSGIQPGTPFEKLPDDWACPVCGANKSNFKKEG